MVLSASVDTQSWPLSGYNSKSSALKVRKSTAKGISQKHLAALSLPRRAATRPASDSPAPNSKTVKGLESFLSSRSKILNPFLIFTQDAFYEFL